MFKQFVNEGIGLRSSYAEISDNGANSKRCYLRHLLAAENYMKTKNKSLDNEIIPIKEIKDYAKDLGNTVSNNTIATKISAIRSYYRWKFQKGMINTIPDIARPKFIREQRKPRNFNIKTYFDLVKQETTTVQIRTGAMLSLIIYSKLKINETLHLKFEELDLKQKLIVFKNKTVDISDAYDHIMKYLTIRGKQKGILFISTFDNDIVSSRQFRRLLSGQFNKYFGQPYDFRDIIVTANASLKNKLHMLPATSIQNKGEDQNNYISNYHWQRIQKNTVESPAARG